MNSRAQIVVTIGPACGDEEMLLTLCNRQMDIARLNFSWGDEEKFAHYIKSLRDIEKRIGRHIPIVGDLSGPRIQEVEGHTYDKKSITVLTERDKKFIRFGVDHGVDYFALSFVGSAADVLLCRKAIESCSGRQRIIAKIERAEALANIDAIIEASDAIMIARGDLGNEVPLERIPFVQAEIIAKCKKAGKPVITATQMMLSMVEHPVPTRAEVTDVANAILQGSDAVMLSDETAAGKYPLETVIMMEKIVIEAELHIAGKISINPL